MILLVKKNKGILFLGGLLKQLIENIRFNSIITKIKSFRSRM